MNKYLFYKLRKFPFFGIANQGVKIIPFALMKVGEV